MDWRPPSSVLCPVCPDSSARLVAITNEAGLVRIQYRCPDCQREVLQYVR